MFLEALALNFVSHPFLLFHLSCSRITLTPPMQNISTAQVDITIPPALNGTTIVITTVIDNIDPIPNATDTNASLFNMSLSEPSLAPTPKPTKMPSTKSPTTKAPAFNTTKAPSIAPTPRPTIPITTPPGEATNETIAVTLSPVDTVATLVPTSGSTGVPTGQPTAAVVTSSPTESLTEQPTTSPTVLTPVPSTVEPSASPSVEAPVPAYVALDTVRAFLLEYAPMSTPELFDESTTEFAALRWLQRWMARIPPQDLGRITKKRLVQRWVLAVLYLNTGGPNWLAGADGWMGDDDACDWITGNSQGSCNEDELVTYLDLSNNNLRGRLPKELSLLTTISKFISLICALFCMPFYQTAQRFRPSSLKLKRDLKWTETISWGLFQQNLEGFETLVSQMSQVYFNEMHFTRQTSMTGVADRSFHFSSQSHSTLPGVILQAQSQRNLGISLIWRSLD